MSRLSVVLFLPHVCDIRPCRPYYVSGLARRVSAVHSTPSPRPGLFRTWLHVFAGGEESKDDKLHTYVTFPVIYRVTSVVHGAW
jgi:hypothetical protein